MADYKVVIYVNDADVTHTDAIRRELWDSLRTVKTLPHDFSIAAITPITTPTGPDGKPLR